MYYINHIVKMSEEPLYIKENQFTVIRYIQKKSILVTFPLYLINLKGKENNFYGLDLYLDIMLHKMM